MTNLGKRSPVMVHQQYFAVVDTNGIERTDKPNFFSFNSSSANLSLDSISFLLIQQWVVSNII